MSNSHDSLIFPSGRTVGNCRKDAKRLSRTENISLNEALDKVSAVNGLPIPWGAAMSKLPRLEKQPLARSITMTKGDIRKILSEHPELTHYGMGISSRGISSADEYFEKIAKERERLIEALDECNKALRFLSHTTKRKTINTKRSSYGLKHSVEHYMKRLPDIENYYVANGSFICAAIYAGFNISPVRPGHPNVFINISERSPILIWGKLKPRAYRTRSETEQLAQIEDRIGIPTDIRNT